MAEPNTKSTSIPFQLLMEAIGKKITVEVASGETFRGKLDDAGEALSCMLSKVKVTFRDGRTERLENLNIPGKRIKYLQLPESLKESSLLTNPNAGRRNNSGRGSRGMRGTRGRGGSYPRPGTSRPTRRDRDDSSYRTRDYRSERERPRSNGMKDRLGRRPTHTKDWEYSD